MPYESSSCAQRARPVPRVNRQVHGHQTDPGKIGTNRALNRGRSCHRSVLTNRSPHCLNKILKLGKTETALCPGRTNPEVSVCRPGSGSKGQKFLCTPMDGGGMLMIQPEWTVAKP